MVEHLSPEEHQNVEKGSIESEVTRRENHACSVVNKREPYGVRELFTCSLDTPKTLSDFSSALPVPSPGVCVHGSYYALYYRIRRVSVAGGAQRLI